MIVNQRNTEYTDFVFESTCSLGAQGLVDGHEASRGARGPAGAAGYRLYVQPYMAVGTYFDFHLIIILSFVDCREPRDTRQH